MPRYAPLARTLLLGTALALATFSVDAQNKTAEELRKEIQAQLDKFPYKDSPEASVFRGSLVFLNYCTTCHGVNADGTGRAAKMYNPKPANLRTSMYPDAYKEMVIRKGGQQVGRSEFMPPWNEELTNEQIKDTVNYLRSIAPANAPK
jgi:mono/diheme cytochrome c family protein